MDGGLAEEKPLSQLRGEAVLIATSFTRTQMLLFCYLDLQ